MFEKGIIFSADLRPILYSEERFCRTLKNCSLEKITLSRVEISHLLQGVLSPKVFAGPAPTYLF
jgi:hypothetical protein